MVIGISIFSVVIILLVEVPLYVLAVSNYRSQVIAYTYAEIIVWGITYGVTILLNLIAFIRITMMKHSTAVSSTNVSSNDRRGSNSNVMMRFLSRIRWAAGQLILASLVILVTIIFSYARATRGEYSDPHCYVDPADVLVHITVLAIVYSNAVAVWFVSPSALAAKSIRNTSV